jgi:hypothetical protein
VGLQQAIVPSAGSAPADERTAPSADAKSGVGGGTTGGRGSAGGRDQQSPEGGSQKRDGTDEARPSTSERPVSTPSGAVFEQPPTTRDSAKGLTESATSGSTAPVSADSKEARAAGGRDGKSVGESERAGEDAKATGGSTQAESAKASEAARSASEQADDSTTAQREGSNNIDLPEFEVHAIEADKRALERAGNAKAIDAHPVTGVWEQIDGGNGADFGPGGYERSILMLNPATKVAAVYRIFRGSIVFVMGGELALELPPPSAQQNSVGIGRENRSGTVEFRTDPSLSSRFPSTRMPLGVEPPRFAEPPTGASPWTVPWRREAHELILNGKRYAPTTLEVFESLRRGGGDLATAEERRETAPAAQLGSAIGAGGERTKEAAFFGVRGGGKRFVFIVDISGSMSGAKLDRLKQELTDSVRDLDDDAEFSIVFFAGTAHVIDQGWMQAKRDRDRAIALIAQQGCNGGTDPTDAFSFAFKSLSPVPDCIFFMTDGMIPPWIPDHVRALNAARIPTVVHTIVTGTAAEEPAMRPHMERIATENQGSYTFVPQ